jgi:hypothetical protein
MLRAGLACLGVAAVALWVRLDARPVRAASTYTLTWQAEDSSDIVSPFRQVKGTKKDKRVKPQKNSGSGYVEIPDKANGDNKEEGAALPGKCTFKVNVPAAGSYHLWARVLWPNGCGNSFYVGKAGGPSVQLGEDGTYDAWHWLEADSKFVLARGVNVIELRNREDGVLCDEIQITTGDRVPVGEVAATNGALVK